MRRAFLLILASLVLISGTCQAATINPIRFEGGVARVSGTAAKNTRLSVTAVKKGETPTGPLNIGLVYELMTDEKGDYSFELVINDLPDGTDMTGWYTLSVTDSETETEDFYFATEKGISSFLNSIKTAKINNSEADFKTAFTGTDSKILECLGIEFGEYTAIKDAVITAIYHNCTAEITKDSIYRDYCKALGYVLLNQGNAEGVEKYNPEFNGKSFGELTDSAVISFIKEVMTANKPYGKYSNLEENYKKAYALNEVNTANSAKLSEKLATYEALLTLSADSDYQYYKSASGSVKAAITEDIVEALYIAKAYTESELLTVIKTAVSANKPQNTPGGGAGAGGGGGGGSSGGGGGGGSAFAVSKEPGSTVKPDNSQDKNTTVFSDLSKTLWAENAISYLYERGIVNGTGFGTFEPNRDVKREEFIKMLILATSAYEKSAVCEFTDIDKKEWYYPYVASAYQNGIVTGYGDNTFGVGESLTREEAATMLARCADSLKTVREYKGFKDDTQIADWAKVHIVSLYKAGIINGADGSFCPQNKITRAEAAQMLYGYLKGGV